MSSSRSPLRRAFRIFGYLLVLLVTVIAGIVVYIKAALPNVGKAPELHVALTPEKIGRGKYLANAVCVCMDCHSKRDWTKYSGPMIETTTGMGGERFDQNAGFPGVFYSRNITPSGISRYTDGELFRVITTGVTKEGRAMFPVMPYLNYGKMDSADITSIIAYLRSLTPIANEVPESKADFPVNIIINTIPQKSAMQKKPDESDVVNYGRYLVTGGACIECHTPADKGKIIEARAFSGGREFQFIAGAVVRSANITCDKETGIGDWTEEMFVNRFKAYADSAYQAPVVSPTEKNTIMPWMMYSHMKEPDLKAIYAFLKTLPPIKNKVNTFSPPPAN